MTVSSTTSQIEFTGDDSTTTFPTGFKFAANADLTVSLITTATGVVTAQTITTHYTVTGAGDSGGGDVEMITPPASTETLRITRWVTPTQLTDYVPNDPLKMETLESDFDHAIYLIQQLLNRTGGHAFAIGSSQFLALDSSNINQWDAEGKVLADLATPSNTTDAVTKAYVDAISAAAGNLPTGDPVNNILVSNGTIYVVKTPAQARAALDVQQLDAQLTDVAGITISKGGVVVSDASNLVLHAAGTNGYILSADSTKTNGVDWVEPTTLQAGMPRGHISGLTMSNNGSDVAQDLDIAVGTARDSTNASDMTLATAITKQLDASWAASTDATPKGGLSSSLHPAATSATWYHVFLIIVGGDVDVGFDTSVTAANLVTDHIATAYRRIGSIWTDATPDIVRFTQHGDHFSRYSVSTADWTDVHPNIETADSRVVSVPTGVVVKAQVLVHAYDPTAKSGVNDAFSFRVYHVGDNDVGVNNTNATVVVRSTTNDNDSDNSETMVLTDTSAQVRTAGGNSETACLVSITALGWIDDRGKND